MQLLGGAIESGASIYSSTKNHQTAQLQYESQLEFLEFKREELAAEDDSAIIIIAATIIIVAIIVLIIKKKS